MHPCFEKVFAGMPQCVLLDSCALYALRTHDTQAPILDFGIIKLGNSKSLECSIKNLDQQEQQVDSSNTFTHVIQFATCVLSIVVTGAG